MSRAFRFTLLALAQVLCVVAVLHFDSTAVVVGWIAGNCAAAAIYG